MLMINKDEVSYGFLFFYYFYEGSLILLFLMVSNLYDASIVYHLIQSIHIFKSKTNRMSDNTSEQETFKASHGKQINGKFYTYAQLQSGSPFQKLKDLSCYIVLIVLIIFCVVCFYEVDYKKNSQQDVINKITKISNYSMGEIVNGSLEATEEFKKIIKTTFEANSGENIKQWMTNKTGSIYTQIKSKIDGQESMLDSILHLPIYIKNSIVSFYQTYILGGINWVLRRNQEKVMNGAEKVQKEEKVTIKIEETIVEVEPSSSHTFIEVPIEIEVTKSVQEEKNEVIAAQ